MKVEVNVPEGANCFCSGTQCRMLKWENAKPGSVIGMYPRCLAHNVFLEMHTKGDTFCVQKCDECTVHTDDDS